MSICCLAILCFDSVSYFENQIWLLLVGLPLYALIAILIFSYYGLMAWNIKRQFIRFIDVFEKQPEREIEKGLSFLGYDEDNTEET